MTFRAMDIDRVRRPRVNVEAWKKDIQASGIVLQHLDTVDAARDKFARKVDCTLDDCSSPIRLFAVSATGHSVCVLVRDYRPFLYLPVSERFGEDKEDSKNFVKALVQEVERRDKIGTGKVKGKSKAGPAARSDEEDEEDEEEEAAEDEAFSQDGGSAHGGISASLVSDRLPLTYHRPHNPAVPQTRYTRFLRVSTPTHATLNKVRKVLEKVDEVQDDGQGRSSLERLWRDSKLLDVQIYEANVSAEMRLMIEIGLVGGAWFAIKGAQRDGIEILGQDRLVGTAYSRLGALIICKMAHVQGLTPRPEARERENASREGATDTKMDWGHVAKLRTCCLSICFLPEQIAFPNAKASSAATQRPSKKAKVENEAPPTFVASISMVLTDDPLHPAPEDERVLFTHTHPQIRTNRTSVIEAHSGDKQSSGPQDGRSRYRTVSIEVEQAKHLFSPKQNDVEQAPEEAPCRSGGSNTYVYKSEGAMLQAWWELMIAYDPDIIVGYDISDSLSSLLARPLLLDSREKAKVTANFSKISRVDNVETKGRAKQIYSAKWVRSGKRMSATSNRQFDVLTCPGRWLLDQRLVMEREERLASYSLEESYRLVCGRPKELLSSEVLANLWSGRKIQSGLNATDDDKAELDERSMRRFADYAIREAELTIQLIRKSASIVSYLEMARVTGLSFREVLNRGQMIRTFSLLLRFCKENQFLVPTQRDRQGGMTEGSLVLMPEPREYNTTDPIVVLDFKSLYPSIIRAHNLCYSTQLHPDDRALLIDGDYASGRGPYECFFVNDKVQQGILPRMLRHLIDERAKVRTQMKSETDPTTLAVLNGRQLALKISANAMYGACGAEQSFLQSLPIAETVIVTAADMLKEAKAEIERRYSDVQVVYGDTDSLFVKCPGFSVKEAIEKGKIISREVSTIFKDPISLDFEKVLWPNFLVHRKRYAGLQWTQPEHHSGILIKGLEAERRDVCPLTNHVMSTFLDILLRIEGKNNEGSGKITEVERQGHLEQAYLSIVNAIKSLMSGQYHVGEFILTKGLWLGTNESDYKSKQDHIAVIDKIRTRTPWVDFKEGERIPFVFIQAGAKARGYEKAEDPGFAIEHGLQIDYKYYLVHQLEAPLTRLLELTPLRLRVKALFSGPHTAAGPQRLSSVSPTKSNAGSGATGTGPVTATLGAFFKAAPTKNCLICKSPVVPGQLVCEDHDNAGSKTTILTDLEDLVNTEGRRSTLLAAACHSCQGGLETEIYCTNKMCSVYYKRTGQYRSKAGDDLSQMYTSLS